MNPIEAISNIICNLFSSDDEKLDKKALILKLEQETDMAQIELNKIEAAHTSIFVAGARPAILWVCAISIAAYFLPQYIMGSVLWIKMCLAKNAFVPYPIQINTLIELIGALLGLRGLGSLLNSGVLGFLKKIKGVIK